ncbi:MAG: histidine phosphatase family protein [Lachnospiraceae bacterium]
MRNWSENQITLVFIRHGATKANREHRYLGKTDEPLSAEGIKALQGAKDAHGYPDIDYLFSSPMKRCRETAELLYPHKEAMIIGEWEEMDFGDFEGKNYMELKDNRCYQTWIDSGGKTAFPEGEDRETFIKRCRLGFYRMLKLLAEKSGEKRDMAMTVGLVVHGGTIMSLLSSFCGGDYFDYQVANGKGYICKPAGNDCDLRLVITGKI